MPKSLARELFPALLTLAACGGATSLRQDAGAAGASAAATGGGAEGGGAAGVGGEAQTADASGTAGGGGESGTAGSPDAAGASGSGGETSTDASSDSIPEAPSDGGVDSSVGVPVPPYDGGIVRVINGDNWNETTIHPFSQRRMLVRDEGDPHLVLLDFSRTDPVVWKTVTSGAWARGEQLIGNNQVMGSWLGGYEVFDLTTGARVKTVNSFGNTQAAYRMANGETMLTRSGTTLDFLDRDDRVAHSISYPGFGYVRLARPTREGTFLVPSDTTVFEGDASGKVLWSLTAPPGNGWAHVFEPLLMSDGKVVLSTFFGSSLDVIDRTTLMVTKRYGTKTIPNAVNIRPNAFAEFQILPNGNVIATNWVTYNGIQILELNPAGEVIWTYRADPKVFSAIQGVQVIDGLDPRFLHALEISPNSTWPPVIPTP